MLNDWCLLRSEIVIFPHRIASKLKIYSILLASVNLFLISILESQLNLVSI